MTSAAPSPSKSNTEEPVVPGDRSCVGLLHFTPITGDGFEEYEKTE
jgi:hypothetical protein